MGRVLFLIIGIVSLQFVIAQFPQLENFDLRNVNTQNSVNTKTCNEVSFAKEVYFREPSSPRQFSPCSLAMQLNTGVCQIRVDIEVMDIQPPELPINDRRDSPRICPERIHVNPRPLIPIPPICGYVTNNHFYIHMPRSNEPKRTVNVSMILQPHTIAIKTTGMWRIKLTQLDCTLASSVTYVPNPNLVLNDLELLAPEGCLQFFNQPMGTIKSFGYDSLQKSTLATQQSYAACIKKPAGVCGIRYTFVHLMLSWWPTCASNYIYIPESGIETEHLSSMDKLCNLLMPDMSITIAHPGPQYLHVKISETLPAPANNVGFSINYDTTMPICEQTRVRLTPPVVQPVVLPVVPPV